MCTLLEVVFLYYKIEFFLNKMSRLNKSIVPTFIESQDFEELPKIDEYVPQHPMLALHAGKKGSVHQSDHLENYVEVQPFAALIK